MVRWIGGIVVCLWFGFGLGCATTGQTALQPPSELPAGHPAQASDVNNEHLRELPDNGVTSNGGESVQSLGLVAFAPSSPQRHPSNSAHEPLRMHSPFYRWAAQYSGWCYGYRRPRGVPHAWRHTGLIVGYPCGARGYFPPSYWVGTPFRCRNCFNRSNKPHKSDEGENRPSTGSAGPRGRRPDKPGRRPGRRERTSGRRHTHPGKALAPQARSLPRSQGHAEAAGGSRRDGPSRKNHVPRETRPHRAQHHVAPQPGYPPKPRPRANSHRPIWRHGHHPQQRNYRPSSRTHQPRQRSSRPSPHHTVRPRQPTYRTSSHHPRPRTTTHRPPPSRPSSSRSRSRPVRRSPPPSPRRSSPSRSKGSRRTNPR